MKHIYLDFNATTPVSTAVREAMLPFFDSYYGNPSSAHLAGRICQEAMSDARSRVAACIGADREEILFTSGGTESNNLALIGSLLPIEGQPSHLIISAIEHPATSSPAQFLQQQGIELTIVGCNRHGVVDPDEVADAIRPNTRLISIMHSNNEIGTIQPIAAIGELCKARNIRFHTDAAQSIGKTRIQVNELGVDLLSIAGHKAYAPKGVGALYVRQGTKLSRLMHGADHEKGMRPGTENVPYIVGLGIACEQAQKELDDFVDRVGRLRDQLYSQLCDAIGEPLTVHGFQAERLANTLSVVFPRVPGHALLDQAKEICASTGSACHSGGATLSPTLQAMCVDANDAAGTVRLSLGKSTSEDEIARSVSGLAHAWENIT